MAINGGTVLIFVYDKDYDPVANGNKFADKYIPVAEQTSLSTEQSVNLIEANYKGATFAQAIYGRAEGTLTVEALVVPNPTNEQKGYLVLKNSLKQRKKVLVKKAAYDGAAVTDAEYAEFMIDTMATEYPDNEAATLSVDLMQISEWSSSAPAAPSAGDVAGSSNA